MTESDAKAWLLEKFGTEAFQRLSVIVAQILDENSRQNLISRGTMESVWARHVVDSAQLIFSAGSSKGHWMDIGTGAGFPGLVVATLTDRPVTLVEPRSKRAHFLEQLVKEYVGSRGAVEAKKAQFVQGSAAVISARAVATLDVIFANCLHLATAQTLWLLPKGRNAVAETAAAEKNWHGMFHVEPSITDPDSMIVVAQGISRR